MASPATFAPPLSPEDMAALRYRPGGPLSYLQGNPGVPPGSASLGQQFQPDSEGPDASAWLYGGPPDPAAFKPQISSSGPGGQGLSAQPEAPAADPSSSSGAGKALAGRMPPPPMPSGGSPDQAPATSQPQGPPPAQAQAQPVPASPVATPAPPASPKLSRVDQIQKEQDANEASKPSLHTNWAQRLALAVLSATKLAPYAQQIVHPKFTEQMGAYENTAQHLTTELGNAEKAENIAGLNEQRAAVAGQRQAQGLNYAEALKEKTARDLAAKDAKDYEEKTKRIAALTKDYEASAKGREKDTTILDPGDPNLPELLKQGWSVRQDARVEPGQPPKMIVIPPAFVHVTPEILPWSFGHQVGDLIPWSEEKENRQDYFKQQQQAELEASKAQYGQGHQPNPEQQFISEFQQKNPKASVAEAQRAYALNQHVPPEQAPPQALMIGPDGKAMVVRPGTQVPQGSQTPAGVNQASTPTSQSRSMAEMAGTVTAQVPALLSQIDSLKAKIGPVAGRWNQLWVNRAGMNDPEFAGLDQDLDLFASALVRTHFGGRGGQGYREALKKDFSQAQSPEDLKARIQHADKWLEGYKQIGGQKGPQGAPPPVSGLPAVVKWGRDAQGNPVRLP